MKFGKLIKRQANPAYAAFYLDYKTLKKATKDLPADDGISTTPETIALVVKALFHGGDASHIALLSPVLARFLTILADEAQKISKCYNSRLSGLQAAFTHHQEHDLPRDALVSLKADLEDLRSFAILNHLAFLKITKKWDKQGHCSPIKETVLVEGVMEMSFYKSQGLADLITRVDCALVTKHEHKEASKEDYSCPVCLDVLQNPVVLTCAHKFCWQCLAKASVRLTCCPVCRKGQDLHSKQVDQELSNFVKALFPDSARPESPDDELNEDEAAEEFSDEEDASDEPMLKKPALEQWPRLVLDDMFELKKALQHAKPGNMIIFDIDETLLASKHGPCQLMTPQGVQAFNAALNKTASLSRRYYLRDRFQDLIFQRDVIEPECASVVRQLQQAGCKVFGLTSRYSKHATTTREELAAAGIDLELTSPFPKDRPLMRDSATGAVLRNGIIYTNARAKGPVLRSFFEKVLYPTEIANKRKQQAAGTSIDKPVAGIPREIVFLDDRVSNVQSVLASLESFSRDFQVAVTGYEYCRVAIDSYTAAVPPFAHDAEKNKYWEENTTPAELQPGAPPVVTVNTVAERYRLFINAGRSMFYSSRMVDIQVMCFFRHNMLALDTNVLHRVETQRRAWHQRKNAAQNQAASERKVRPAIIKAQ